MFLWEWLVWKWLLITSLWLALLKWWSMHQAKSMSMPSRVYRNFVHTISKFELPSWKFQQSTRASISSKISNDKKEIFVSYQILIHFNVRILHTSWKHSQISLFNSSVHEKVAWNAQQKYLNHMMHKWHTGIYLNFKSPRLNLFNSSFIFGFFCHPFFYSSHVKFDFPYRIIRNITYIIF